MSANSNRIARNTLLLYGRQLLIMAVNLYTSRVVLDSLGASDYGVYSVIGGFVSMFSVVSGSLTAAISRFITFELGKSEGVIEKVQKVFSTSVIIQILISLIIVVFAESIGLWFLNAKMTIPADRLLAANIVYQFSILTFVINLISVPYNALIVAHEKMSAFAYIGVFQAIGTLLVAIGIAYTSFDRLVYYGVALAILAVVIRFLYGAYCKTHFAESKMVWHWDKCQIKEIFGFAGWNFIGSTSGILRDQGVNILLNLFFGPIVNAARGIAVQVSGAITSFSNNFMMALNPQITKSYASNDFDNMKSLVFRGSRFSYYLLLILALPVIIETQFILELWLKEVPNYTIIFVRLVLVQAMVDCLSNTLITVMLATGRIKKYQLVVGGCTLMNFPLSYVFLKLGFSPQSTLFVAITICIITLCLRLKMLKDMIGFPARVFYKAVLGNVLLVSLLSLVAPLCISWFCGVGPIRFICNAVSMTIVTSVIVYSVGCSSGERAFINREITNAISRFKK